MFILLAVIAVMGYALQAALVSSYYRRDPLFTTALRGLSLGITMLPLVFLSGVAPLFAMVRQPGALLVAAVLALVSNVLIGTSYRHLAVGIAVGSQLGASVITSVMIGIMAYGEMLGPVHLTGIAMILLASSSISLQTGKSGTKLDRNALAGTLFAGLSGVCIAGAYAAIAKLSRDFDALAAAWSWEFTIGIMAAIALLGRFVLHRAATPVGWGDFWQVLLRSWPTLVGTGGFALALKIGPLSISMAILSTTSIAVVVLNYFLYRERTSRIQLAAIAVVTAAIVLLRLAS